jgi:hypothetical protein
MATERALIEPMLFFFLSHVLGIQSIIFFFSPAHACHKKKGGKKASMMI